MKSWVHTSDRPPDEAPNEGRETRSIQSQWRAKDRCPFKLRLRGVVCSPLNNLIEKSFPILCVGSEVRSTNAPSPGGDDRIPQDEILGSTHLTAPLTKPDEGRR